MPRRPVPREDTCVDALFKGGPLPTTHRRDLVGESSGQFTSGVPDSTSIADRLEVYHNTREHMVALEASRAADSYLEKKRTHASKGNHNVKNRVPLRVRQAFEAFDFDRSGFLSNRELRHALRMYGLDLTSFGSDSVLAAYDTNPDGQLDMNEFHMLVKDAERGLLRADPEGAMSNMASRDAAISTGLLAAPHSVRVAFNAFDHDNDGFLDYTDVYELLKHHGANTNRRELLSLLAAYATVTPGKLSVHDFSRLLCDLRSGRVRTVSQSFGESAPALHIQDNITPEVRESFNKFDANRSGFIECVELKEALKHHGIDISDGPAARILAAYDGTSNVISCTLSQSAPLQPLLAPAHSALIHALFPILAYPGQA